MSELNMQENTPEEKPVNTTKEQEQKKKKKSSGKKKKKKKPKGFDFRKHQDLIAVSSFLLIVCIYVVLCLNAGKTQNVFILNGLKKQYQISINGQSVFLPALSYKKLEIPLGPISVRNSGNDFDVEKGDMQLTIPFFTRPFAKKTFVINPDRTAIIIQDYGEYSEVPDPSKNISAKLNLYVGRYFYQFDNISEAFPDKVNPSPERINRLFLLKVYDQVGILKTLNQKIGMKATVDFCKNNLRYNPEDETYLYLLSAFIQPDEYIAFLRPQLPKRPVMMEWHRFYQESMEKSYPGQLRIKNVELKIKVPPQNL